MARKYQEIEDLLKKNPKLTPNQAAAKLGIEGNFTLKQGSRIGLRYPQDNSTRTVDLDNTTLDPLARKTSFPRPPNTVKHHAFAVRLIGKLHEQFELNENPNWKKSDGPSEKGKNFLRNLQNRLGIVSGDNLANHRHLPIDNHNNKSSLHNQSHDLARKLGVDPAKANFKNFSNSQLWEFAQNKLKPAIDSIDNEIGHKPSVNYRQSGAILRGKHNGNGKGNGNGKLNGSINLIGVGKVDTSPKPPSTKLKVLRNTAKGLAVAGIVGIGPLGTAASASETITRHQIADMTQNPMDRAQAHISSFSLAADGASYAPPATFHATVASTAADILNAVIDSGRDIIDTWFSK